MPWDCLLSGGDDIEMVVFVGCAGGLLVVADCQVEGDWVCSRGAGK